MHLRGGGMRFEGVADWFQRFPAGSRRIRLNRALVVAFDFSVSVRCSGVTRRE